MVIPLGFVMLVGGKVSVNAATLDAAHIAIHDITALENFIDTLLALGEVVPTAASPPQLAFTLNARQTGKAGN